MNQDYESINSDLHAASQFEGHTKEDLISLVSVLTIQIQDLQEQVQYWRKKWSEEQPPSSWD